MKFKNIKKDSLKWMKKREILEEKYKLWKEKWQF